MISYVTTASAFLMILDVTSTMTVETIPMNKIVSSNV